MSENRTETEARDLQIPGGCPVCGGALAVRVVPGGARAYCRACQRISRPAIVPGPAGPVIAELAAAA